MYEKNYFNLVAHVIKKSIEEPKFRITKKQSKQDVIEKKNYIKRYRRLFANGNMVRMFCDCSDNFEHKKLKEIIINYNSPIKGQTNV